MLFATGREAALEYLRLENVGVTLINKKIQVDGDSQTAVPSIYAVGDCVLDKSE